MTGKGSCGAMSHFSSFSVHMEGAMFAGVLESEKKSLRNPDCQAWLWYSHGMRLFYD